MGSNVHGFSNEQRIHEALHNAKCNELNPNLLKFIKTIFKDIENNDTLVCKRIGGVYKPDISISNGLETKYISIKSGRAHGIHQQPVEEYIKFLKQNFSISTSTTNDLRFFIWGDGTLDGTGKFKDRLEAKKIKKKYPEKVNSLKEFFGINKKKIISKVILGYNKKIQPNYLYYGDVNDGIVKNINNVINFLCNLSYESKGAIPIGRFTFQAWNRSMKGNPSTEKKLGHIQMKWGNMQKDLELIK